MTPHPSRRDWIRFATACIAFVAVIGAAQVVGHFAATQAKQGAQIDKQGEQVGTVGHQLDSLTAFSAASRSSRIEFQARETFLLCSRDLVKTVIPERRSDVAAQCTGYETMADAIRTERAKQAAASPP